MGARKNRKVTWTLVKVGLDRTRITQANHRDVRLRWSAERPRLGLRRGLDGANRRGWHGELRGGRLGFALAYAGLNPGDAQCVQDEQIVNAQSGWILNRFPSVHDVRVAGNAPRLVADDAFTMLANCFGGITIAMKPGVWLRCRHGHSSLPRSARRSFAFLRRNQEVLRSRWLVRMNRRNAYEIGWPQQV